MPEFVTMLLLIVTLFYVTLITGAGMPLSAYIHHYEPLVYDHHHLHHQHHRATRSTHKVLKLDLRAHGRTFKMRLHHDIVFSNDLVVENSDGSLYYDTNRAYVGHLKGEPLSSIHGVVTSEGLFEGKINTMDDQYSIERSKHFFDKPQAFHSVIYKSSDIRMDLNASLCKSDELHRKLYNLQKEWSRRNNKTHSRIHQRYRRSSMEDFGVYSDSAKEKYMRHYHRRAIDPSKTTCPLYVQADHLFYRHFHNHEETVIEQLTQHVQGINQIYSKIDFDRDGKYDKINFIIKRIKVHTNPKAPGYKFPGNYGVEKFLEMFSEDNFDAFCLAYMFTYRDFEGGTLGLAWTGDLQNAGGVCERNGHFRGSLKSLNTGIVTILNYMKDVPSAVSHVTMAHEIGHNMGSQHDPETKECSPGGEAGNYIMFARATSGDKPNNNKFSRCSSQSMAVVMEAKARHPGGCFIGSICGNEVVEANEECDCGWDDQCTEDCCYPQTDNPRHRPCTRKPGTACSPSQGPCCSQKCQVTGIVKNQTCREATSCTAPAFCNGLGASCPPSLHRPDKTKCDEDSVCFRGECTGSICIAYGLESCQCPPRVQGDYKDKNLCKLCCKLPGEGNTCRSSFEWNYPPYDIPNLMGKPGMPCNNYNGYCDVFLKCREVDPDGPLAALKKIIFSEHGMQTMKEWLTTYWYVVAAGGLGLVIFMVIFVKLCTPKRGQHPTKHVLPSPAIKAHPHPTPGQMIPPSEKQPWDGGNGEKPWIKRSTHTAGQGQRKLGLPPSFVHIHNTKANQGGWV